MPPVTSYAECRPQDLNFFFTELPKDIVLEIFLNTIKERDGQGENIATACTLQRVCKQWQRIVSSDQFLFALFAKTQSFIRLSYSHGISFWKPITSLITELKPVDNINAGGLVKDSDLQKIGEGFPNLKRLDLTDCYHISVKGLFALSKNEIKLEALTLSDKYVSKELPNDQLLEFLKQNETLQSLRLLRFNEITKGFLTNLACFCPLLKKLEISCSDVLDEAIAALLDSAKNLEELKLIRCALITKNTAMAIAKSGQGIRSLHLPLCYQLNGAWIDALTSGNLKLETLNLSPSVSIYSFAFWGIEDSYVKKIADAFPHLKRLILSDFSIAGIPFPLLGSHINIGDASLIYLCEKLPYLQELAISGCSISNEGLKAIARKGHQLEKLNLWCCKAITNEGLTVLAENCPRLRALNINNCFSITDKGVEKVLKSCKELEVLECSETCVTENIYLAILNSENRLKMLHLPRRVVFPVQQLRELIHKYPSIEIKTGSY